MTCHNIVIILMVSGVEMVMCKEEKNWKGFILVKGHKGEKVIYNAHKTLMRHVGTMNKWFESNSNIWR